MLKLMKRTHGNYHSYLLRLWQVQDNGIHWRATLEDVQTGRRYGFAELAELQRFLEQVAATGQNPDVVVVQQTEQDAA